MIEAVYIQDQRVIVKPDQLIRSGGEGMVFETGDMVLKLYHQPQRYHHVKLNDWLNKRLQARLPGNVYGPVALAVDESGQAIGFLMRRLPVTCRPLKQLSSPNAWEKDGYRSADVIKLLLDIHRTLLRIHKLLVIVGDLNDHNIFFEWASAGEQRRAAGSHWIDADSFQFGEHPCPVAMRPYLDPNLYAVDDLTKKPHFTTSTDWYAYTVLVLKCLLQVHPYGGVHRERKTIEARAMAGISILNSSVTYPRRARPLEALSDDLLHHVFQVFEKQKRMPFPEHLLIQYATSLTSCTQCGLSYPSRRRTCPTCHRKTTVAHISPQYRPGEVKLELRFDGFIEYVAVQPSGRIVAVVRTGSTRKLVKADEGGRLQEMHLFNGHLSYRFGFFSQGSSGQYLVVAPSEDDQLLILDVSGSQPRPKAMVKTARFRHRAVFATSAGNLFRIAGNMIMRGSVRYGHYVEDMIATAHSHQTIFWASPFGDVIAGYHRVFADEQFFLIDSENTEHEVSLPPVATGDSVTETSMTFSKKSLAVIRKINHKGRSRIDTRVFSLRGIAQHSFSLTLDVDPTANGRLPYPFTTDISMPSPPFVLLPNSSRLTGSDYLHGHPGGVLVQQPNQLFLIKTGNCT